MKKITGILIDVENGTCGKKKVKDRLETYYEMLKCSCIEIAERKIGKKEYAIICDEEGLMKDQPQASAFSKLGAPMLYGNIYIVGLVDQQGDLTSLTDDDIVYIEDHMVMASTPAHRVPHIALGYVDYIADWKEA